LLQKNLKLAGGIKLMKSPHPQGRTHARTFAENITEENIVYIWNIKNKDSLIIKNTKK
jgi:hypothetical protein